MNIVKIPPNENFNCWTSLIKASVAFVVCFQAQAHKNGKWWNGCWISNKSCMRVKQIENTDGYKRKGCIQYSSVKYWQIIIIIMMNFSPSERDVTESIVELKLKIKKQNFYTTNVLSLDAEELFMMQTANTSMFPFSISLMIFYSSHYCVSVSWLNIMHHAHCMLQVERKNMNMSFRLNKTKNQNV